ncbi:MAG: hypothetical protein LQ351_006172 [Letrouitia transgressa]|nr:MAG: hypothetical protein LQ351_006172 [Letrouitia transgressa]
MADQTSLAPRPKDMADHLIAPKTLTHRMRLETIRDPTDKSITPFAERVYLSTNPRERDADIWPLLNDKSKKKSVRRLITKNVQYRYWSANTKIMQKVKKPTRQRNMSEDRLLLKDRKGDKAIVQKNVAMNVDATEQMRYFLRLRDPGLANLPGNLFMDHPPPQPGIQSPLLNISGNEGVATSFLASPCFTTTLAENIHRKTGCYGPNSPVTRPYNPPGCSEFVKHLALYLYEKTLCDWGAEYTRVVQQPGEIMIIFPFAYYQNYSNGFNIMESNAYANERWRELYRNGLISQCSEFCRRGPHEVISKPIRLDSMLGRAELQSSRPRKRKRDPESPTDSEDHDAPSALVPKRKKLPPRLELAPKDTTSQKNTSKKKWFSPTSSLTSSLFQYQPRSSSFTIPDPILPTPRPSTHLQSSRDSQPSQNPSRRKDTAYRTSSSSDTPLIHTKRRQSDSKSSASDTPLIHTKRRHPDSTSSSDTPLIQRRRRNPPTPAARKKRRTSTSSKRDFKTAGDEKEVTEASHLPRSATFENTAGDTTEDDDTVAC